MLLLSAATSLLLGLDPGVASARRLIRCDPQSLCLGQRPIDPSERDARPFQETLGRPCGYRWRYTPSGTRRVRVCF